MHYSPFKPNTLENHSYTESPQGVSPPLDFSLFHHPVENFPLLFSPHLNYPFSLIKIELPDKVVWNFTFSLDAAMTYLKDG